MLPWFAISQRVPAREVARGQRDDQATPSTGGTQGVDRRDVSTSGGAFLSSGDPPSIVPSHSVAVQGRRRGPSGRQGSGSSRQANGEGVGPRDGHHADQDIGESCPYQAWEQDHPPYRPSVLVREAGLSAELTRWA